MSLTGLTGVPLELESRTMQRAVLGIAPALWFCWVHLATDFSLRNGPLPQLRVVSTSSGLRSVGYPCINQINAWHIQHQGGLGQSHQALPLRQEVCDLQSQSSGCCRPARRGFRGSAGNAGCSRGPPAVKALRSAKAGTAKYRVLDLSDENFGL